MPTDQTARLRELHDHYVWMVNAAVAEGRQDLVDSYCADYVDEAVRIMAGDWLTDRAGSRDAERPRPPRWRRLLRRPG